MCIPWYKLLAEIAPCTLERPSRTLARFDFRFLLLGARGIPLSHLDPMVFATTIRNILLLVYEIQYLLLPACYRVKATLLSSTIAPWTVRSQRK